MVEAKHVSGKNIYWSTFIGKSKERKIFDFLHCPFEPPAKQHRPVSQLGWILWCMLARPSKGQCRNSKIFPPLLLTVKVDQNIFFPETCFASTISEPEFMVWEVFEMGHFARPCFHCSKGLIWLALTDPQEFPLQHLIKKEEQPSYWKRYSVYFGEVSSM